jgi:hypothetical protein
MRRVREISSTVGSYRGERCRFSIRRGDRLIEAGKMDLGAVHEAERRVADHERLRETLGIVERREVPVLEHREVLVDPRDSEAGSAARDLDVAVHPLLVHMPADAMSWRSAGVLEVVEISCAVPVLRIDELVGRDERCPTVAIPHNQEDPVASDVKELTGPNSLSARSIQHAHASTEHPDPRLGRWGGVVRRVHRHVSAIGTRVAELKRQAAASARDRLRSSQRRLATARDASGVVYTTRVSNQRAVETAA